MDQVVTAIITPVVESLVVPVKRHLGFLFSSTNYVTDMRVKLTELHSTAIDTKRRKEHNDENTLMVPHRVPSWLEEAQVIIDNEGDSNSAGGNGCLHMKRRYKAGKHCFKLIADIDRLMREESNMKWTNKRIPLDMVRSAAPKVLQDVTRNIFTSRQLIFQRALQLLEPDNTTQMVALCGMGGIGKTTMMEELEKVVKDMKLFDRVVKVFMGNSIDPIAFQGAIAQYTGENLSESTKEARADRLKERFLGKSQDGKKKILIILDDLWNVVDLKDIGLASPLPKGFKLFLTSRDERLCGQMGVETSSILKMGGLEEPEAKQLFWLSTGLSDGAGDQELHKLGEDIVMRCGGLPMAIKTIALALRGEIKDAWKLTLSHLERHDLQDLYAVVHNIFEISYDYLKKDDDQKIFILSGLFPDDFDIPLEDLMRYGWGLKLFNTVCSFSEARQRTNTSVHNLIRANLLVESHQIGCVKMHDLARSFVLSNISKFKQASSDLLEWHTRKSCERILLNCQGMSEFPQHFDYPNLKLLKLMMNEKESLMFPDQDFYATMKKLEVISYRSIPLSSLPISLQCPTSLRMLSLHSCSLMGDLSYLGYLSNLEILSFAYCPIESLPSAMGKLRNLKLLDLTGCGMYHIGDGVFQNLHNLEELYMRNLGNKVIRFTKDNCEGLEKLLIKLSALEVEIMSENIIRLNNVSFKNLERFRISIGCHLDPIYDNDVHSFENTLRLVASCEEVRASEINELFEITTKLHLQLEDMNHLEDVLMPPSDQYSFRNLKHLSFKKCANLKYLFTVNVASTLTNLERLKVKSCGSLRSLIHGENKGAEVIKFRKLKLLKLYDLPEFLGLCDHINIVMELPQLVELKLAYLPNFTKPLLNKEVVYPKLEELEIRGMEKLKEIWTCEEEYDRTPMLKVIEVVRCDEIHNLFPKNPMRLLSHLETLTVEDCGCIQALFDIDLECVGQANSSLRSIRVSGLGKLREVWRISGEANSGLLIRDFHALECIQIKRCENFRNIITPTTNKFEMGGLTTIIESSGYKWGRNNRSAEFMQDQEFSNPWCLGEYSREITIKSCNALSTVIPSYAAEKMLKIEMLKISECTSMREIFETKELKNSHSFGQRSGGRDNTTLPTIPRLQSITMHRMPNLKILAIQKCPRLVDIFPFSTLGSLGLLEKLSIRDCKELKVIVREEHGEQTTTTLKAVIFPCLKSINLADLPNLTGFFFGKNEFELPLLDEVIINECPKTMVFTSIPLRAPMLEYTHINGGKYPSLTLTQTPSQSLDKYFHSLIEMNPGGDWKCQVIFSYDELLQLKNLEKLNAIKCHSVLKIFDIGTGVKCSNSSQTVVKLPKLIDEHLRGLTSLKYIWKSNGQTILEFPNLTKLTIYDCNRLKHVFTCSMVGSLLQLKVLSIRVCNGMEVIVKEDQEEEGGDGKVNEITLPCLKSLELEGLASLKGFCLGNVDYLMPSLDRLKIIKCKSLTIFTKEGLFVPKLKVMETSLGSINLSEEQGINSFIITKTQEGFHFGDQD